MKNNVINFVLAGLWFISAIFNIVNNAFWVVIGYNLLAAVYFLTIAISQKIYSNQGEQGIKTMRKIQILSLILLFALVAIITIIGLK